MNPGWLVQLHGILTPMRNIGFLSGGQVIRVKGSGLIWLLELFFTGEGHQ